MIAATDNSWVLGLLEDGVKFWGEMLSEIWDLLGVAPKNFKGGAIWGVMVNINDGIKYIAYSLLVIFFGVGLIKTCMNLEELKRPEIAVKYFVRYILTKTAVTGVMSLMNAVFSIAQLIVDKIIDISGLKGRQLGGMTVPDAVRQACTDAGFWESVPLWLLSLLGTIVIVVISLIAVMSVYSRFFKIYLYTAIAPIPLSSFAGEPTQGTGWAFVKSYIGVCMEGAVIALAAVIYSYFATSNDLLNLFGTSNASVILGYIVELVFNMLVFLGIVKLSSRLIHEIFGL